MHTRSLWFVPLGIALLIACDTGNPTASDDELAFARNVEAPELPPADDFVDPTVRPNPFFPLVPGTVQTFRSETEDGIETTTVTVTNMKRNILGIEATVVLDQVLLEGVPIEITYDWHAQDRWGNIWYLGEDSCEFEEGSQECNPAGSWEAGVDGAQAGIIMWAEPLAHRGKTYRQEFFEGEAEDMAKVLRGGLNVTVPAGRFSGCLETMDFTPLDPGVREHKFYCPGAGLVLEIQTRGGRGRNALIRLDRPL